MHVIQEVQKQNWINTGSDFCKISEIFFCSSRFSSSSIQQDCTKIPIALLLHFLNISDLFRQNLEITFIFDMLK